MIILLILIIISISLSGIFDAISESLKFHPSAFFKRFPNANLDFWLIGDSWDNKWKNGDPQQGEKFWQSSRAFVFLTDGYHLMRMFSNIFCMISITIPLIFLVGWIYALSFPVLYLFYTGGFSIVFDKFFKS